MKKRNFKKITIPKLWDYLVITNIKYTLWHFSAYFPLFPDFMSWKVRPFIWRLLGVHVGKNIFIGYGVYLDVGGASRIHIGDNALIAAQCLLLSHKRNLDKYQGEELQNELPFKDYEVHIESNVSLGMRTMVLPGITIGKDSVIAAYSVVSKDIPSKVMAVGNPIKIIKKFDL